MLVFYPRVVEFVQYGGMARPSEGPTAPAAGEGIWRTLILRHIGTSQWPIPCRRATARHTAVLTAASTAIAAAASTAVPTTVGTAVHVAGTGTIPPTVNGTISRTCIGTAGKILG